MNTGDLIQGLDCDPNQEFKKEGSSYSKGCVNPSSDLVMEELTSDDIAECERCTRMYVERDDFEIEITNVAQITEYFRIFKTLILQKEDIHRREVNFLMS